jgi:hypothetical protein
MTAMRRRVREMEAALRVVASSHAREVEEARSEVYALRQGCTRCIQLTHSLQSVLTLLFQPLFQPLFLPLSPL